jgi:hypothetical protein
MKSATFREKRTASFRRICCQIGIDSPYPGDGLLGVASRIGRFERIAFTHGNQKSLLKYGKPARKYAQAA